MSMPVTRRRRARFATTRLPMCTVGGGCRAEIKDVKLYVEDHYRGLFMPEVIR